MPNLGVTFLLVLVFARCTIARRREPPKFLSDVRRPVTEVQVPIRLNIDPGKRSRWWKLKASEGEMVVLFLSPGNWLTKNSKCRKEYVELFDYKNDSLVTKSGRLCGEDDKHMYSSGSQAVLHVVSRSSYVIIAFGQGDNPEYVGYMFDGEIQESPHHMVYISTNIRIPTDGSIEGWEIKMTEYVSIDTEDKFKLAVFRPGANATEKDENFVIVHLFNPDYSYCFLGTRSVIPMNKPLAVQRGDRIGFIGPPGRIPIEGGNMTTQKHWLTYYVSPSNESQLQEGLILSRPYSSLNHLFAIGVKLSRGKSCALKGSAGDFDGALVGGKCGQVAGFLLPRYSFRPSTYYWKLNAPENNVVLKTLLYSNNLFITDSVLQLRDFPGALSLSPGEYEIRQEGDLKQFLIEVQLCECQCEFNSSRGELVIPFRDTSAAVRVKSNSDGCKMTVGHVKKSDDTHRYNFVIRVGGRVKQKTGNDCLGLVYVRERVRSYKRTLKELCYDGISQDVVYVVTTSFAPFEIETMLYASRVANLTTPAVWLEYQEKVLDLQECNDSVELNRCKAFDGPSSGNDVINFNTKLTESECTVHLKADQEFNFSVTVDIYHGDYCLDYVRVISMDGSMLFDSCKDAGVQYKKFPAKTKEIILKFLTDGHEKDASISIQYRWLRRQDSCLSVLSSEEMNGVIVFEKYAKQVDKRKALRLEFHPPSGDTVFLFVNELRACEPIEILVTDHSEVILKTYIKSNFTTDCFVTSLPERLNLPMLGGSVELTYWKNVSLRAIFHTNVSLKMCAENNLFLTYPGSGFCYGPAVTTDNVYNGWPTDAKSLCPKGSRLGELSELKDLPKGFLGNFKLPKNTSFAFRDSVRRTIRILPYDLLIRGSESVPVVEPDDLLSTDAWTPLCTIDVDECSLPDVKCSQRCVNEIGSYRCSCDNGYYLLGNNVDCKGICEYVADGLETQDGHCVLTREGCAQNSGQNMECATAQNTSADSHLLEKYFLKGNITTLNQSGILTSPYGYITSPRFPLYSPLENGYWWKVCAEKAIRLTVLKYRVKDSHIRDSSRPRLIIYDWSLPQRYVINQVWEPTDIRHIFSASSSLAIALSSSGSKTFILQMVYSPEACSFGGDCRNGSRCGQSGVLSANGKIEAMVRYGGWCLWHFKATKGSHIFFERKFSLGYSETQVFNGMKAYGVRRLTTLIYGEYIVYSWSSSLTVFLQVPHGKEMSFSLRFTERGCGGCVQVDVPRGPTETLKCMGLQCGHILSPNYPYFPVQPAQWYIVVDWNQTVELSFSYFAPDRIGGTCPFDRSVKIYRSMKETSFTSVCGINYPRSKYTSINNIMKIAKVYHKVKFTAKYETVASFELPGAAFHNLSGKLFLYLDWVEHENYSYKWFSNTPLSWQAARSLCQGHSADLVSILNEEEMWFVFNYFEKVFESVEPWFIGLTDLSGKNRFKWSDGNPPSYLDWIDFRVSGTPQPSLTAGKDCVMFDTSHFGSTNQWIKVSCVEEVAKSYMCKRKQKGQTDDDKVEINSFSDCGPGWMKLKSSCVRVVNIARHRVERIDFDVIYFAFPVYDNNLETLGLHPPERLAKNWDRSKHDLMIDRLEGSYNKYIKKPSFFLSEHKGSDNSFKCSPYDVWSPDNSCASSEGTVFAIIERPLLSSYGDQRAIKKHLFPCGSGEHILATERCDGHKDCPDGSEEIDCELPLLGAEKFMCENGAWISAHYVCDFHRDCQDGSDEYCVHDSCSETDQFSCRNDQCIPREKFCDTFVDCKDGSDEKNCYECLSKGTSSTFMCHDGTSIFNNRICNGQVDCPGTAWEDEPGLRSADDANKCEYMEGCAPDKIICENGFCADLSSACLYEFSEKMGYSGCQDMTHLRQCELFICPAGYVKCPRSYCIPLRYVCNGEWDCPYGVDETNCTDVRCPGEYRCRQSQQCISLLYNTCDGVKDCPLGDDEELCDMVCPDNCSCIGASLDCSGLSLTDLPWGLESFARSLNLSRNTLNIDVVNFDNLTLLGALDLSNNNFTHMPAGIFDGLKNLYYLNLKNNSLRSLSGIFSNLHLLKYVFLTNCGTIKTLTANMFNSSFVVNLDMSGLGVEEIEDGAFNNLPELNKLDIQKNPIKTYSRQMFKGIRRLDTLFSDSLAFCCILREKKDSGKHCTPEEDHLSSCSDLMAHMSFRVFLWLFGLLAFLGNLGVIILRLVTKDGNQVHSLMIGNLAVADGLMGVYMVIIAAVDTFYRGRYIVVAENWKKSPLCQLCGIMATMSSEVSVFTLTLITLDRFINIVFPLRAWRISVRMAKMMIVVIWTTAAAISIIPVLPLDYFGGKFYGRSGVCLPFQLTQGWPSGWEYSTALFIILNAVSCMAIFLGYVVMYWVVRRTHRATRATVDKQRMNQEMALARRMILIVCTDLFCWIPIIATGLLSVFSNVKINGIVYAVIAVFVLPINSALNPVLYTYSTVKFRKSKKAYGEVRKDISPRKARNLLHSKDSQTKDVSTNTKASFCGLSQEWVDNSVVPLDVTRVSSLTQCLEEGWTFLPEHLLALSRDITAALTYLHQSKLCHGAVYSDNILIYKDSKTGEFRAYLAWTKSLSVMDDQDVQDMSADDLNDLQMVMDMLARQQEHTD